MKYILSYGDFLIVYNIIYIYVDIYILTLSCILTSISALDNSSETISSYGCVNS
jgi:hypothetical protein